MKKGNATLVFIALIVFTAIAWMGTVKGQIENTAAYNDYMKKAASFEEKGIYVDALENYESALALNPNEYDIVLKIADMYFKMGDINGFITTCDKAIDMSPKDPTPYVNKVNYYISKSQFTEAIKVVKAASSAIKDNEEINKLKVELSTKCIEKYVSFTTVSDWHVQEDTNYVAVEENGKWGMTLKDGTCKIRLQFDYLGAYDAESGVIPCCFEGNYYYIDLKGNKKLIGDNTYQFLGSFGCGLAPAQRDGKYGYIDTEFTEKKFEFEYAGAFANDVAAVKKDGKWALINTKLDTITGFDYDEILVDSNGYCSTFDVIVARQGDKYLFINHKGKQIGKETFDGATLSASNDSYIAIKKGEKWGYADQEGKVVIEPNFDGAKSFSMGMAPVKVEDRWGYINTDGKIVVETKYFDAGVFSQDGAAPVKNASVWNFIVLCEYDD